MIFQAPGNFRDMFLIGRHKNIDTKVSPYDFTKFTGFDREVGSVRVSMMLLFSEMNREPTVKGF